MVDYSLAFVIRAQRAIAHGIADAGTFAELAAAEGVSIERIAELLQDDLNTEGPIFGKFMRSLRGAATASVRAAEQAGDIVGHSGIEDMDLDEVLAWIDEADPDDLAGVEESIDDQDVMWVAMLVDTCHICLPIHGTVMTRAEFKKEGMVPGAIHPASWASTCKCRFVPLDNVDVDAQLSPLQRVPQKDAQGRKLRGRTVRDVAQVNLDKSQDAVGKSQGSAIGRRTLRAMGRVNR